MKERGVEVEKLCPKCGAACDTMTGLCPECDRDRLEAYREILAESESNPLAAVTAVPTAVAAPSPAEELNIPEAEEDPEELSGEARRNGILAVIASFLAVILIVSLIMIGVSNGWIGGKAKKVQLKSAYAAYLNRMSVPELGMYDLSHPKQSAEGIVAAKQLDLNDDRSDEFVIVYYEKNADAVDFKLSCLEYNSKSIIQGKKAEGDGTQGVELNATVTAFSFPDYNNEFVSEEEPPGETAVYTVKSKGCAYIAVEHLTYNEGCVYELHLFTLESGVFKEVGNLYSEGISNDGSVIVTSTLLPPDIKISNDDFNPSQLDYADYIEERYHDSAVLFMTAGDGRFTYDTYYSSADAAVSAFASEFRIKKKQYILTDNDSDRLFYLSLPEEKNMMFFASYYLLRAGAEDEEEVRKSKDYTDYILLLYEENKTAYDDAAALHQKQEEDEALNSAKRLSGDIPFGDVVRIGSDTYYWRYNATSFSSSPAEIGNYDYKISAKNELICRDGSGEEKVITETNGAGALAVAGGRIFYQRVTNGYNHFNIYSCNLDGSYADFVGEGRLLGTVQNGAYVLYATEGDPFRFASINSIKIEDMEKTTVAYNARFLFTYEDRIYYQAEEESAEDARRGMTTLCSVNGNGSSNRAIFYTAADLYEKADYDSTKAYILHPYVFKDYVYYAYGSYDEDGAFNGGALVKCRLDGSEGEVIGISRTETFTLDGKGNVYSADDEKIVGAYSYENGDVRTYDPAADTLNTLITKEDYAVFSPLLLGEDTTEQISLRFAEDSGKKLYFAICEGAFEEQKDTTRLFVFRRYALFEKDTATGKTTLVYQTEKSADQEDDED